MKPNPGDIVVVNNLFMDTFVSIRDRGYSNVIQILKENEYPWNQNENWCNCQFFDACTGIRAQTEIFHYTNLISNRFLVCVIPYEDTLTRFETKRAIKV